MPGDTALARVLALVRDLRTRCSWDRTQTRATLRPYLVEEALELDQALKQGDAARLRDELGDLLLHLAFQIVIGEERGEFDAETVTRALEQKMRRRHPHLFGLGEKPQSWELGDVAFSTDFTTDGKGLKDVSSKLPAGIFRVIAESQDKFGKSHVKVVSFDSVTDPGERTS